MRNVIIVGKWATSKRFVTTRKTQPGGSRPGATRQSKQQTKKSSGGQNNVKTVEPTDSADTEEYPLYQLTETSGSKPIELKVKVQGKTIPYGTGHWGSYVSAIRRNIPEIFL